LDAGTEVNDEISSNTAFLNQAGPDIGITENGVITLHPGLESGLAYPDGVLNHPVFANGDFLSPNYRAASFNFRFVDLGRTNLFRGTLSADQEVSAEQVISNGRGQVFAVSRRGNNLSIRIIFRDLTSDLTMAHLHNAAAGSNGPVVVNLTDDIRRNVIISRINAEDVLGPLTEGDDPFLNLLNELAAGNIYVNLHTEANPAGELRAQVLLR